MNRSLARTIISALRSSTAPVPARDFREFEIKDWERTFDWLDDSGLALYFHRHLQATGTAAQVFPQVLSSLEIRYRNNRVRWDHLAEEFARTCDGFQRAGFPFAVIKGLSLVPEYCPEALLRAPSDLDFMIRREDLALASRALEEVGYRVKTVSDIEIQFWKPTLKMPTISDSPYSARTEPLVELHFAFWDDEHRIPLREPLFSLDRVVSHSWQGMVFPVLDENDAFLLQVIHVFQHITTYWVKMAWLLEIGNFISRRALHEEFWRNVDDRMEAFPGLREYAGVVVSLVRNVFGVTLPAVADGWTRSLGSNSRLWLAEYAEKWLIDDHPFKRSGFFRSGKLALFLHQQYLPDLGVREELIKSRLFPWKRPDSRSFPADYAPSHTLRSHWTRGQFILHRVLYHAGTTLRYLFEVPRWTYRTHRFPRSPETG